MDTAGQLVRAGVARADRLRRSQAASRRLWRAAPAGAGLCACAAAGSRWAGWPPALPLGILALEVAASCVYVYSTRRDRTISDTAAAEIDTHAALGGELRSASWFASRECQDPWVAVHVARAAGRMQAIDWAALYPAVRARRAKIATSLMVIAALALALPVPGRAGVDAQGPVLSGPSRGKAVQTTLPADLQKQLEDVLSRAEHGGTAPGGGKTLTAAEVHDLLARLEQFGHLQASTSNEPGKPPAPGAEDLKAFAERAKRASEMAALSPAVRDALSQVSENLSDASDTQPATAKDPQQATGSADMATGDAALSKTPSNKSEVSIQSVKEAGAAGGTSVVMMSSQDSTGGQDSGMGLGGGSSQNKGGGRMPEIGAALRRETIEAQVDGLGENITTDIRRKTERGDATVGYAHTAPPAFERGRSTARPPVPERRRAAVQSYFIRKQ